MTPDDPAFSWNNFWYSHQSIISIIPTCTQNFSFGTQHLKKCKIWWLFRSPQPFRHRKSMRKWPCHFAMKESSTRAEILCTCSYDTYVWLVRVSKIISTERGVIRGHKGRAISRFFWLGPTLGLSNFRFKSLNRVINTSGCSPVTIDHIYGEWAPCDP